MARPALARTKRLILTYRSLVRKLSSVLLVDDDPTNNFLNERLLKRLDVTERITAAAND